jgi:hypothetical protein
MEAMRHLLYGLLALALLGACRGPAPTAIDRDRFVETVVELRQAAMETRSEPAAYEARKAQVLQRQGVSEAELREYVEVHGRDVEHMAEVWNAINNELTERGLSHVQ